MSTQVKLLSQVCAGAAPRVIVGILPEGPRLVGFNSGRLRLADQVRFGLRLDLAHLELLCGLASGEPEADTQLLDRLAREYGDEINELGKFARRFREARQLGEDDPDAWRPPVPESGAGKPACKVRDLAEGQLLAIRVPLLLRLWSTGFEHINQNGEVGFRLGARELSALRYITNPLTFKGFLQRVAAGDERLSESEAEDLLNRLLNAGQLRTFDPGDPRIEKVYHTGAEHKPKLDRLTQALFAAIARADLRNPRNPACVPVYPVNFAPTIPPLALGYLFTVAKRYKGGLLKESFDFRHNWLTDPGAPIEDGPMIQLYSHYIWNSSQMLAHASRVKAANPSAVNIHGGPDVPKYERDVERYFAEHPYVDVAVHGEGEITICEILEALSPSLKRGEAADLSLLNGVAGLSYRGADDRPVRTADRPRIADLDEIPSPYLEGEFDVFAEAGSPHMIVESNRGCPYGCTFCDWGSATASKIRKFDLDRVYAELEWGARNHVEDINFADANFGVFDRDVEITQRLVELKSLHGFPQHMGTNYAKNSVKNLKPIIERLVDNGIIAMGLLSLQSMDDETLSVIKRSNIKLQKYEALAGEFRANNLPLYVDLMMGLPGSTVQSFLNDLQECIDREVFPKIFPTVLLMNSPMNEPAYREMHGITARPSEVITSCKSYSSEDYREMIKIRRLFLLAINFGVLRHALRYARQETGTREIDLLLRLMSTVDNAPERWPALRFTLLYIPHLMVPPVDWGWLMADLRRYFVEQLGIADDAALDSVLRAQHAMLPAPERRFPETIELPCDYAAWYADVQNARENGHLKEWFRVVPPLRSYGPGRLTVTDPNEISEWTLGTPFDVGGGWATWELSAEIARPSVGLLKMNH